MPIKLLNPPVKLCAQILEFVYEFNSRDKECGLEVIKGHFAKSPKYFDLALAFLLQYELINCVNGVVTLSPKSNNLLDKSIDNSKKLVLERLMTIQPFVEYTYFLGKGKNKKESAKLVKSLYGIKQDEDFLMRTFDGWIKILGIKVLESVKESKTIEGIKSSLQNKLYANNFVKENLGHCLRYVSEQVLDELSSAIKEIPNDNEESINATGRALEDFLRINLATEVDLTGCSGIAEIANELNRHPTYPKKLNNLCIGLSSIRSMGKAHGSDKLLKIKWSITEPSAIGYILMTLSVIKSYLVFKHQNRLMF